VLRAITSIKYIIVFILSIHWNARLHVRGMVECDQIARCRTPCSLVVISFSAWFAAEPNGTPTSLFYQQLA
jgi:hypothetical protein